MFLPVYGASDEGLPPPARPAVADIHRTPTLLAVSGSPAARLGSAGRRRRTEPQHVANPCTEMTTTRLGHAARLTTALTLSFLAGLIGVAGPSDAQSPDQGRSCDCTSTEWSILRGRLPRERDPGGGRRRGTRRADRDRHAGRSRVVDPEITQATLNADVPVVCRSVGRWAASAGSFVLLSPPRWRPARTGAATPVGIDGAVGLDKAVNDAAASMRAIAEEYDRNADVAESFVTDAVSISAEQALADGHRPRRADHRGAPRRDRR